MYVIIVYDIKDKRVLKVNKYLKRYLIWVQNSVFEGEITEALLEKVIKGLTKIIAETDSVIVYKLKSNGYLTRVILGNETNNINNVI